MPYQRSVSQPLDKRTECPPSLRRKIRSFVKRQGRTSKRQLDAINTLMPRYGIKFSGKPFDLALLFEREAPTVVEIGFGMGDTLARMALDNPQINYLGIEVHTPGIGNLLATIDEHNISNIRIINHDAVEVLQQSVTDGALDRVQIFFPDPWPKKRHHKRRLVQPNFITLLSRKIKSGGVLHIATDWENYAQYIEEMFLTNSKFTRLPGDTPNQRPTTKFEKRGLELGHGVWDLIYGRKL